MSIIKIFPYETSHSSQYHHRNQLKMFFTLSFAYSILKIEQYAHCLVYNLWLTCLLWVNNSTLCCCFFQSLSSDSMTIIFPDRFQYPYSSTSSLSLGKAPIPSKTFGPPVDKSGWLQILRNVIRPGKTYPYLQNIKNHKSYLNSN